MNEQHGNIGRTDALNAGGLTDSRWPKAQQFLHCLAAQTGDLCIVHLGWNTPLL
jgi:hypothetical protein